MFISHPRGSLPPCGTCATCPEVQRKSRGALGEQRQRPQWIESSYYGARRIIFSSGSKIFCMCTFRSQRRGIGIHARAHVGSSQIAEIATESMATCTDKVATQSKTKTMGRNRWSSSTTPLRSHFGRTALGKKTFETQLGHVFTWECLYVTVFLSVYVEGIKMARK